MEDIERDQKKYLAQIMLFVALTRVRATVVRKDRRRTMRWWWYVFVAGYRSISDEDGQCRP
jgi:hypothetical protein